MAADNRSLIKLPKINMEDILTRLPLPSLLVCCCVSKSLLNLIKNDPDFARSHLAKSESQLVIHSPMYSCFHCFDLDTDITTRVEIKPSFNLPLYGFEVTCSSNGLLLLEKMNFADDCHHCMVFNPVTGEYTLLPENETPYRNIRCAFFYCPITNQFKVFRAFYRINPHSDASPDSFVESDPSLDSDSAIKPDLVSDREINSYLNLNSYPVYIERVTIGEIFVGGSDSWEFLGNLPISPLLTLHSPCQLNKATYWLSADENVTNLIVFFNFETHQFGEIPAPAHINKTRINGDCMTLTLVVLDGFLSIFDNVTNEFKFDVWVMKEHGVRESWTREYVIDTTMWAGIGRYGRDYIFKPVLCRNNGEVVMVNGTGHMIFYDLVKKKGRIVNYPLLRFQWNIVAHTFGLMSLRYVVRGNNLEVLNVASRISNINFSRHNYMELAGTF